MEKEKHDLAASPRTSTALAPIVWVGTSLQLGDFISALYKKKLIQAKSRRNAFMQLCQHFVKDGKPVDYLSVLANLNKRGKTEAVASEK